MSDLIELIAEVDNWNRISTKLVSSIAQARDHDIAAIGRTDVMISQQAYTKHCVFRSTDDSRPLFYASHHAEKETQCH